LLQKALYDINAIYVLINNYRICNSTYISSTNGMIIGMNFEEIDVILLEKTSSQKK